VRLEDVPETGRRLTLSADDRTRDAVAAVAGLRSLPRLDVTFDLARHGRDGLRVTGEVSATVGQTCVVTLELMESEVTEVLDLVFKPAQALAEGEGREAVIDPAVEESEPLIDGTVDLGALATEFLILGIDPYSRKPGAVFEPPPASAASPGPFAALAALQKNRRPGRS